MKVAQYYKRLIKSNAQILQMLQMIYQQMHQQENSLYLNSELTFFGQTKSNIQVVKKILNSFVFLKLEHKAQYILKDLIKMIKNELYYKSIAHNNFTRIYSGKKAIIKNLYSYSMQEIIGEFK